ncbi:helix-turn-helix domain-containing protein [Streptomyces spiramenti]|uniref:helix-turn-helix domain-containing protein n=1 Tax=Streptomyces spiramenti TaxID=2720606 RepID=UPI001ADD6BE6|nr:helix-turn-helix domain-containing protein [Streptomyces spiramenti]
MPNSSDLSRRRAELTETWSRWVPAADTAWRAQDGPPGRPEVADSWRRSLPTVDPLRDGAPVTDGGAVHPRWAASPLRAPVTAIGAELRSTAEDAGYIAAVTDRTGTILWTCGGRVMRRRAERVNFAPGGRWNEPAMGTNALALTLRTGRPSTVFSAEHLVEALHGWVCYCAPVRAPDGRILGVVDLSSTWDRCHPMAMSMVRTAASAIEARLAEPPRPARVRLTPTAHRPVAVGVPVSAGTPVAAAVPDGGVPVAGDPAAGPGARAAVGHDDPGPPRAPSGATPAPADPSVPASAAGPPSAGESGPPYGPLLLRCLGETAHCVCDGAALPLPPRQLEILTLLALEPLGLTPAALRLALYGDQPVTDSTLKAEVSHLRRALGGHITPRRYGLTRAIACDAVQVLRALDAGDLAGVVRRYRGPLLPRSDAPGVAVWRGRIEVAVRSAVLGSEDPEILLRYGAVAPDDVEVHERTLARLAPDDPRRAGVRGLLSAALAD